MNAEQIAELRKAYNAYDAAHDLWLETGSDECHEDMLKLEKWWRIELSARGEELLATAEREAKLRAALEGMTDLWLTVGGTELNPVYEEAVAALETKGGET